MNSSLAAYRGRVTAANENKNQCLYCNGVRFGGAARNSPSVKRSHQIEAGWPRISDPLPYDAPVVPPVGYT